MSKKYILPNVSIWVGRALDLGAGGAVFDSSPERKTKNPSTEKFSCSITMDNVPNFV